MRRINAFGALTLLIAVGACADVRQPTSPLRPSGLGPSMAIEDGAHGGDNSKFFFLPPMVRKPSITAEFHPGLRPRVEICELNQDRTQCSFFTGFTAAQVRFSLADKHYYVNWDTKAPDVLPDHSYRITVLLGNSPMGFADVHAVANGSQLKSVDTEEDIGLVDGRTLPIKFFLGHGVTCHDNPNGCAEYTVTAAEGGTFQSLDQRSGTDIPPNVASVEEFTLTIEKLALPPNDDATCHTARPQAGLSLVKEFDDCYEYTTSPAVTFKRTTNRAERVVVALCATLPESDPRNDYLQIFRSHPPEEPPEPLEDAEAGVDFPFDLINCEGPVSFAAPPPGSGLLAQLRYGARRLAAGLADIVTPKPAYAIDLGEGGFLGLGGGFSFFRWGIEGHLHAQSPLERRVTAGNTAEFSALVEGHKHHHTGGDDNGETETIALDDVPIQFTLLGSTPVPPVARTNAAGVATTPFTFNTPGSYEVTARHVNGGDAVTFNVTVDPVTPVQLISCPGVVGSGNRIDRGFYVQSYPGTSLDRVDLELSARTAGIYTFSLSARLNSYDGALIGTSTATATLNGIDTEGHAVSFLFPSLQVPRGSLVTFTLNYVSRPGEAIAFYNVQTSSEACPVVETEDTTPPLSTFRRNGISIGLYGAAAPPPPIP